MVTALGGPFSAGFLVHDVAMTATAPGPGLTPTPLIGHEPEGGSNRLRAGQLGMVDIAAATMANIGPAMSFFFGFGFLALTAGVAAPLTIIAAGIAVALLGNTLAQFSKAQPSAGGFITFVGKTFGATTAVTTALLTSLGYIIAMASVIAMSGGITSIILEQYFHIHTPWFLWAVVLTGFAVFMMMRGIAVSTKVAGFLLGFEMLVLVVVSVGAILANVHHLSLAPFDPGRINNGVAGLAAGFPLAIYMFIGWENSAALAEETENPRKNVGRAVLLSVATMMLGYVLFAYATIIGFHLDVDALGKADIPFIAVAQDTLGAFAVFAYLAAFTSTLSALIAGVNSQARLVFSAGREGLLPSFIGRVHPTRRTPLNAILVFVSVALGIVLVWWLLHLTGVIAGTADPVSFFAESSTMGTILIMLVYLASNVALPFYYRRYYPAQFSAVRHGVLPILGALALLVPLYYLCAPGQEAPYSWFPFIAAAVLVLAVGYAIVLTRRDPALGDRVGAIVADAD